MRVKMSDQDISSQVMQRILIMSDEEFAVLSVGRLADMLGMDRYKMLREFKRMTKTTLEDFIHREKMMRAAFLLLGEEGLSVKHVAEKMGFCTADYFIRKFKAYYNVGPGKYKEYKTRRSEVEDRRVGDGDRRKTVNRSKIPRRGDRRVGKSDRRRGLSDRRKKKDERIVNGIGILDSEKVLESGIGKNCDVCLYKVFAEKNGIEKRDE